MMPEISIIIIFISLILLLYCFFKTVSGGEKYPGYGRSKNLDIKSRANHWHREAIRIGRELWGLKELSFDEREELEAERQRCGYEHQSCCHELDDLNLELFGVKEKSFKSHGDNLLEKMGLLK
jgi:hypothetical protein